MALDPKKKRETWLFQDLGRNHQDFHSPQCWRRLMYNLVRFDGEKEFFIEPRPESDLHTGYLASPTRADGPFVENFQVVKGAHPFECFSYGDPDNTSDFYN